MNRVLLKGLRVAGLCLMAMAASSASRADEMCPPCPPQPCPSCPGYCRTSCCDDCCLKAIEKWALCCNYYILPPDYGWNAPVKVPVVRRGVTYYRYYPEHWYGTSSPAAGEYRSYPQVYSPTDTTQLGYTYQQVPYWQPAPYRLPPPPVPSQWHVREPHYGYHGRWHSCYTPIHHHQSSMCWVEPIGRHAMPVMPQAMPVRPSAPVGCPPAPEPAPSSAPKTLTPEPAAPAAPAPEAPPAPAPASDAKTAAKIKSRLTTMLPKF